MVRLICSADFHDAVVFLVSRLAFSRGKPKLKDFLTFPPGPSEAKTYFIAFIAFLGFSQAT